MSKRRRPGEMVLIRPNSGFLAGGPTVGVILLPMDTEPDPCMLFCQDEACQEWPDVVGWREDRHVAVLYHVSECQMEDVPDGVPWVEGLGST